MELGVFYDDQEYMDLIWIPECIISNIDFIQKEFLKWMFNKEINHKYWVVKDNCKLYCVYGTDDFVEYINMNEIIYTDEKARVLEYDCSVSKKVKKIIYF